MKSGSDFGGTASIKPKTFIQEEVNYLIRDLGLPKESAEILAFKLREKNLMASGTIVTFYRTIEQENLGFYSDEQGEWFHQDLKTIEERGYLNRCTKRKTYILNTIYIVLSVAVVVTFVKEVIAFSDLRKCLWNVTCVSEYLFLVIRGLRRDENEKNTLFTKIDEINEHLCVVEHDLRKDARARNRTVFVAYVVLFAIYALHHVVANINFDVAVFGSVLHCALLSEHAWRFSIYHQINSFYKKLNITLESTNRNFAFARRENDITTISTLRSAYDRILDFMNVIGYQKNSSMCNVKFSLLATYTALSTLFMLSPCALAERCSDEIVLIIYNLKKLKSLTREKKTRKAIRNFLLLIEQRPIRFSLCKLLPLDTGLLKGYTGLSHFVIDGGFLLHKVIWDRNSSFKDITTKYVKYVQEHFGLSASIVFDGYSDDPDIAGTKSWERLRRTKKHQSTEVKFDKNAIPTLSQEKFLGNEKNKSNFIILLKTTFSEMGFTVDQAESDADALIVRTALAASPLFNTVTIVAEDIDILILLTALGRKQANAFFFKPSKGRTAEQLYSASGFMYGDVIANNLLFLHAFSGCDTTSAPYNIGKMKLEETFRVCKWNGFVSQQES
ncbi:hypothetical protein EVAR_44647_1 [Eumeta japonica]|uniref:Gustatory receptor n=1 Tax=Eumeta variegata TaxID=151549 RepID=A0A4C1XIW2_EUMVA|nr:hypothetical protein EVAR_44647_1 [Eumeta japonica]